MTYGYFALSTAADIKDIHKGLQIFECSLNGIQCANTITYAMSERLRTPALSEFFELRVSN